MGTDPPYAVIGLGIGTLASYSHPGQVVDFYEIDRAVLDLSMPPEGRPTYFWYLQDALKRGTKLDVKLGDGRLKINEAPAHQYQVIVIDAFSSDAIPCHLLTKEAIEIYLSKLREDGILVFNITNRYVALAPVLADAAKELNLICLKQFDEHDPSNPDHFGSDWAVLFRRKDMKLAASEAAALVSGLQPGLLSSVPWNGLRGATQIDWPSGLPQRLNPSKWEVPSPTGRPAWSDSFQDLVRAMTW
jgi:spermidine synthase